MMNHAYYRQDFCKVGEASSLTKAIAEWEVSQMFHSH